MGRRPKSDEPVYSRIEQLRTQRGLSRQELADCVGVHYQTVGYLERGEYSPSLSLALRLSAVLAAPVEQLFSLSPFAETPVPETPVPETPVPETPFPETPFPETSFPEIEEP